MKKIILLTVIGLWTLNGYSQTDSINNSKQLYVGSGISYSNFQDVRYSNVQYSGIGTGLEIGYKNQNNKRLWGVALTFNYNSEKAETHDMGKTLVLNPNVSFNYLKPINNNFLIGGRIDLFDFYYRNTEGLGNNSNYYINAHHLYGSLIYNKNLKKEWNLEASIDLGLFSFMKESTSFGFSAPQKPLENGEFNYQNSKLSNPFGYKYFESKYIGNHLNLKTSIILQYKKRISIGYTWRVRHFATTKSYPVTTGIHNFIIRYNIINK